MVEDDGFSTKQDHDDDGKELDRIVSKLESKVVEKESVIESLENEVKILKHKYEAANEELKVIEEEKEVLEQQMEENKDELKKAQVDAAKLKTLSDNYDADLERLRSLETINLKLSEEKEMIDQEKADMKKSIEELESKIDSLVSSAQSSTEMSVPWMSNIKSP